MGAARRGGASISKEHVMSQAETSVTVSSSIPVSGAGPVGGWGAERMARGPVGGW
jgi:hypothetical protein